MKSYLWTMPGYILGGLVLPINMEWWQISGIVLAVVWIDFTSYITAKNRYPL